MKILPIFSARLALSTLTATCARLASSRPARGVATCLGQHFDSRQSCWLALFLGIIAVAGGTTLYMGMQAEASPFESKTYSNTVRMRKSTMVVVGNVSPSVQPALVSPYSTGLSGQSVRGRVGGNDFCGPIPSGPCPEYQTAGKIWQGQQALMTLANGRLTTASDCGTGFNVSPLLQGGSFGWRFALPLDNTQPGQAAHPVWHDDSLESQDLFPAFGQCHLPQDFASASILTFGNRLDFFASYKANPTSAAKYNSLISLYAAKYGLTPSLVKAIMQAESNFNPFAISSQQAMGLMQVVPATAGGEVYAYLTGFSGQPSPEQLLQPEFNIQYGTAYLHLLSKRYFNRVLNTTSRDLCVIAAYNGGPGAVVRLFGTTPDDAAMAINALTPTEVFKALTSKMPSQETRQYVSTVLGHARDYGILQE